MRERGNTVRERESMGFAHIAAVDGSEAKEIQRGSRPLP